MQESDGQLLADKAFIALRTLLIGGSLRAGQFLSMPDLVKLIELPMAPVREAVKRVESAGLLRVLPKRGVAVMDSSPALIRECFHLRTIFDQEGARELARRGDTLDALRDTHRQLLATARDGITPSLQQDAIHVHWALHEALVAALDNPSAQDIYRRNQDRILVMQHARPLLPDRIIPAMEEHLAILEAIASGDPEAAASQVRLHFRQTLRWWGIIDPAD